MKNMIAAVFWFFSFVFVAPPSAFSAETMNISFTVNSVASSAPFFIAAAKGYFADQGIDAKFLKEINAGNVTVSVLSGAADIGCVGFSAGFFNVSGNGDLRIIAGGVSERPGFRSQAFVASNKAYKDGLASPADLGGKRIAISNFGGGLYYDLILASEKYHFPIDKSKILQVQSNGNIASAIVANAVDAGVLSSVTALKLNASGDAKIIGWVGDETPYTPISIFTTRTTIAKKRGDLVKVMRAILHAQADYATAFEQRSATGHLLKGPGYDQLLDILAKNVDQPPSLIAQAIPYIEPQGNIDPAGVRKQIEIWKTVGLVNASVTGKNLVDLSILKDAKGK